MRIAPIAAAIVLAVSPTTAGRAETLISKSYQYFNIGGRTAGDLIAATFPGGSITGAPKIRAMDIITEIENNARGPYCGAIGYLGFDGAMDLNIAIRTVSFEAGQAKLSAGGGITVLSDPAAEYEETFTKATRVFAAFDADDGNGAKEGPR